MEPSQSLASLTAKLMTAIDDLRNSPAMAITRQLIDSIEGDIRVVEPNLKNHEQITLVSLEAALDGAEFVVVFVAHRQFKKIPAKLLAEKIVIDICGALR